MREVAVVIKHSLQPGKRAVGDTAAVANRDFPGGIAVSSKSSFAVPNGSVLKAFPVSGPVPVSSQGLAPTDVGLHCDTRTEGFPRRNSHFSGPPHMRGYSIYAKAETEQMHALNGQISTEITRHVNVSKGWKLYHWGRSVYEPRGSHHITSRFLAVSTVRFPDIAQL